MSSIVAIVPARGGSKSIPKKNLAVCAGKPLIDWTIEAALDSRLIGIIIVSSEDEEIKQHVAKFMRREPNKVIFHNRSPELAQDDTPTKAVIAEVLQSFTGEVETIVLLQPTSPLRTGKQIDECIRKLKGYDSCLSVVKNHSFLWTTSPVRRIAPWTSRNMETTATYIHLDRPRRQEMEQYEENGSIYCCTSRCWDMRKDWLGGRIVLYEMPEECGLQIDTPLDLWRMEQLLIRTALIKEFANAH